MTVAMVQQLAVWSFYVANVGNMVCALRANGRSSNSVTPIEKVIALLHRLEAQVTEEGKNEAMEYDKFACFCKQQADFTQHALEKSNASIDVMKAKIEDLAADITVLNEEISDLGSRITTIDGDVSAEKAARSTRHDNYTADATDMTNAIVAAEDAIAALKASKGDLVNAKLDLMQLFNAGRLSSSELKTIASATGSKQQPAAYTYTSNEVITLLQDLVAQFKKEKKELDEAEFEDMDTSSKKVLGLNNERTFKEKAKSEKEELESQKSEQKAELEAAKAEEETARDDDQEFQADLTKQCEDRGTEWDQRSQARSSELTAMAKAIEVLRSGVSSTYSANKKLVGFTERKASLSKGEEPEHSSANASAVLTNISSKTVTKVVNFLQVLGAGQASAGVQRALTRLGEEAKRLQSPVLAAVAAKVELQGDHFVKVRGLIKDLIATLEAQAEDEATQKSFCDTDMSAAITSRDAQNSLIEEKSATITEKETLKLSLMKDIATLADEIAELNKALNEATELRVEEKATNAKTVADAESGKIAVEQALQVLNDFYGGSAFVAVAQKAAFEPYKAPNSDREGKTVADRAPTMSYSGDYKGKGAESKGVIGLLEIILSDFDRTVTTVGQEETRLQTEFDGFESDTQTSIAAKKTQKETKEADVKSADEAIMNNKDALKDAKDLHDGAIKELERLQSMCVDGEESWEERKAQREKEIEALKQAMQILDNWQA
jgi:NACalpha-BTF3-like transcription factor